jgi:hypothetical protein
MKLKIVKTTQNQCRMNKMSVKNQRSYNDCMKPCRSAILSNTTDWPGIEPRSLE